MPTDKDTKAEMKPSEPPMADNPWSHGWHAGARQLRSPNCGPRPGVNPTDLLVIHSISLPPGVYGGSEIEALFTNTLDWDAHPYFQSLRGLQVSAHFVIRRNGELLQFVSCDDRAWHAGVSSYRGRPQCNDDSIGIELEGLEGEGFEAPQYDTLVRLCQEVGGHYPIRHIAGHEHIAPDRKKDPGAGFLWGFLQQALGWPAQYFPESVRLA